MIHAIEKIFSAKNMERALAQFGAVSVRDFLLFSLAGIAIVGIVTIIVKLLGKKIRLSNVLAGVVLAVYSSVILQLTLVCRESGSRIGIELDVFNGLIGPDNDFHWLMMAYVVLNFLMFVPFGFALSLFTGIHERKKGIPILVVTLLSFATSMLIELAQLITQRGYYENQDLLFNTLGGLFGGIIFSAVYKIGLYIKQRREEDEA